YSLGKPGADAQFDYVIVGGGTAGLVLANRLASDPNNTVAVIEAGGFYEADDGNLSTTPAYDVFFAGTDPNDTNPLVDWGFDTTPQAGANGRILHYARGKTLGGSSARNFMLYHRPTTGSLQMWADQVEDSSYTFDNLLPFYEKSVQYTAPSITYVNSSNVQATGGFSSSGGPLQVSFGKYEDPFGTWAQLAFQAVGQAAIKGFQIGKLIGSAYMAFTENPVNGQRSSSESSFLQSYSGKTLTVYNNTLAEKINFSGKDNTATGVVVSSSSTSGPTGHTYTLSAKKEVILSAGAFQSPQLLMVSGIGPADTLKEYHIPVLQDLPGVGQNMWDQPFFGITYRVDVSTASAGLNNATLNAEAIAAFVNDAAGPLTNPATPVIGWERLPKDVRQNLTKASRQALKTFPPDWPELEYLPIDDILGYASNFATGDPVDGFNYATIATALIAPLSRGNLSISSAQMSTPPLINPNWLDSPVDAEVAVAAFKRQREVWSHLSNITIGEEIFPGPAVQSDADILHVIRQALAPIWHAAATCKMGPKKDPLAVVDTKLRVYGTNNLRVVDASAFPFLPPGHPQSTVYALAEKVAADILS
ncbi:MAG: hypothetical protein M1838_002735, partial [Thelocarpon superellum]